MFSRWANGPCGPLYEDAHEPHAVAGTLGAARASPGVPKAEANESAMSTTLERIIGLLLVKGPCCGAFPDLGAGRRAVTDFRSRNRLPRDKEKGKGVTG